MFKELKALKVIIFIILIFFVIKQQRLNRNNTQVVFKPSAYNENEEIKIETYSNFNNKNFKINIKNFINENIVIDTSINTKTTYKDIDTIDFLTQGYKLKTHRVRKMNKGFFLVNNKTPLVVKSLENSDITFVIPVVNKHLYTPTKNVRIFESDSNYISSKRNIEVDKHSKGLKPLFLFMEKKHKVNYITDIDLENLENIGKSKVLVLYGRLTFWSPKMMINIEKYINNGGKLLIASSDIFYAKFCYDKEKRELKTTLCDNFNNKKTKILSWNDVDRDTLYDNLTYMFHSNHGGRNIISKDIIFKDSLHPIFNKINKKKLSKQLNFCQWYIGSMKGLNKTETIVQIDCESYKNTINQGGIMEYKNNSGGKVLSLGSSDLCEEEQIKNKEVLNLFINSIEYLLLY